MLESTDVQGGQVNGGTDMPHRSRRQRNLQRQFVVDQHLTLRQGGTPRKATASAVGINADDVPALTSLQNNASADASDASAEPLDVLREGSDGWTFCKLCKVAFPSVDSQNHLQSSRHRLGEVMYRQGTHDTSAQDLRNIRITCEAPLIATTNFHTKSVNPGEAVAIHFTVLNASASQTRALQSWGCPSVPPGIEFLQQSGHELHPGDTVKLQMRVCLQTIGVYRFSVFFSFADTQGGHFTVEKCPVSISCVDDLVTTLEADRAPKNRRYTQIPKHLPKAEAVEPGTRPPKSGNDNLEKGEPLKTYDMPGKMRSFINRSFKDIGSKLDDDTRTEMMALRHMCEEGVRFPTYTQRFSALLYCEEAQMDVDIKQYDMEGVSMTQRRNSGLLVLEVPGLAENRPSVLRGDHLYVRIMAADGTLREVSYQGFVHEVEQTRLILGFGRGLSDQFVPNMKFHVEFVNNRHPLRLQHRAVELADERPDMEHLLFPSYDTIGSWGTLLIDPSSPLTFYSRNPAPNDEQAKAIRHIVAGTSRPAPYIVFGPPGTGKTFTIVEAMKQVVKNLPDARILACAPSNSAVDNMAEKLCDHLPKDALYRLNAASRPISSIPEKILEFSNVDRQTGMYEYPKRSEMEKKKIIICTLISAGRLASARFLPGHFTHVFVDEASQATEPETMVTISGILNVSRDMDKGGQLVMAGDPKQLGPILRSPLARQWKLDTSLMERLMQDFEPFKRRPRPQSGEYYDSRVLTKLVKNYRSHPAILKPPNELFYEGELLPQADALLSERMCGWDSLPRPDVPLIFHAVVGEDMQEHNSPSFYNPQEISVLMNYIDKLVNKRSPKGTIIKEEHIGIITPYRKQVQKIRTELKKKRIDNLKVGSVEEFQGQERLIIIISAVRSQPSFLQTDMKFGLGFLTNHKRFNVAVTRAKALLVVIGNPNVLCCNSSWSHFIEYCKKEGALRNKELVRSDNDGSHGMLADLLCQVSISREAPTAEEVSRVNDQQEFRRDH